LTLDDSAIRNPQSAIPRPTIILVPGLDGTALLFYRQEPLLAQRFHVVKFPVPDDSKSTSFSIAFVSEVLSFCHTRGGLTVGVSTIQPATVSGIKVACR
jgi:hypothetical protein